MTHWSLWMIELILLTWVWWTPSWSLIHLSLPTIWPNGHRRVQSTRMLVNVIFAFDAKAMAASEIELIVDAPNWNVSWLLGHPSCNAHDGGLCQDGATKLTTWSTLTTCFGGCQIWTRLPLLLIWLLLCLLIAPRLDNPLASTLVRCLDEGTWGQTIWSLP